MIQFDIKNRWTNDVQFTAKINCKKEDTNSVKIGLAWAWGIKTSADMSFADMSFANMSSANMRSANMSSADMSFANMSSANMSSANMRSADMSFANMSSADMSFADMRSADMRSADMSFADMSFANMRSADMSSADMSSADMRSADMRSADMSSANMRSANMRSADMSSANMSSANINNVDFVMAKGISDRIIDGGLRSDGWRFFLTRTEPGEWRVKAGCHQSFTLKEAHAHWAKTRPTGTKLGDETRLIIKNMLAIANLRKWPKVGEEFPKSEGTKA